MSRWRMGGLGVGVLVVGLGVYPSGLPGALRVALGVFGALIALAAWQGRGFTRAYSMIAVWVLNVILIMIALEALASLVLTISPPRHSLAVRADSVERAKLHLQYYGTEGQDWAAGYWDEHLRAADRWAYYPYTLWRVRPFDGEYIHVDERGLRLTPGAACDDSAYRIVIFGGSTVWGFGVPDWGTLPAYVQAGLGERDACVVNYGQIGYNSTQEVIQLLLLLRDGDVPDMVIFYDGDNDVSAAHRTGTPGGHFFLESIASYVHGQPLRPGPDDPPPAALNATLRALLAQASVYRLLVGDPAPIQPDWALPPYRPEFVQGIADAYLANVRLVQTLAREYGFAFFAFVQPVLPLVDRPYSDEEQMFIWNMPTGLAELFRLVYPHWAAAAAEDDRLYYYANVLDDQPYLIWIDYDHLTPWGNLAIAHDILEVILPTVDAAFASP